MKAADLLREHPAYTDCKEAYLLDAALWGGTRTMQARGAELLPQHEREKDRIYAFRLKCSKLTNFYRHTARRLASRPFRSQTRIVGGELPDALMVLLDDADRDGTSLTEFLKEAFLSGLRTGIIHTLVDTTKTAPTAQLDELRGVVGPYFAHVHAADLYWWEPGPRGRGLAAIRYFQDRNGERHVVEWRTNEVILWKPVETTVNGSAASNYDEAGRWPNPLGSVPLVTTYFDREGFMRARSPLSDLADKNHEHYVSSSYQRNALTFSRSGLLVVAGGQEQDLPEDGVVVGANQMLHFPNQPDVRVSYVEHQGHALSAGERDLDRLERQMQVLGARHYVEKVAETATGKKIDDAASSSDMVAWTRVVEKHGKRCLMLAAAWAGIDQSLLEPLRVGIDTSDLERVAGDQTLKMLFDTWAAGGVRTEVWLEALKSRSVLDEDFNVEKEVELAQAQLRGESPSQDEGDDEGAGSKGDNSMEGSGQA